MKSGDKIGVGTGSTAAYVIECLAERYKSGDITDILCVPTSMQVWMDGEQFIGFA